MGILMTGVNGTIRQGFYDFAGYTCMVLVTPLPEHYLGGYPEEHSCVTLFTPETIPKGRAAILANAGFLSLGYFVEKMGPFPTSASAISCYFAVAEVMGREYDRSEYDREEAR